MNIWEMFRELENGKIAIYCGPEIKREDIYTLCELMEDKFGDEYVVPESQTTLGYVTYYRDVFHYVILKRKNEHEKPKLLMCKPEYLADHNIDEISIAEFCNADDNAPEEYDYSFESVFLKEV